jgi:hypothetical protein
MRGKFRVRRPSPAMIIAIVALVAALAGTAIAGGGFLPKSKFTKFKQNAAVKGPITYVNQTGTFVNTPAQANSLTANCPSGFIPIGGSVKTSTPSSTSSFFLFQDYPTSTGWTGQFYVNSATVAEQITVTAICAKAKTSGTPPTASS